MPSLSRENPEQLACAVWYNRVGVEAMMNETARVQFGSEIRRRRELLGMTVEALAERSGMTTEDVGKVETGERDPSLAMVLKLATGLDLMSGELFSARPDTSPDSEEAGVLPTPEPPKSHGRRKPRS
jgi:DNA-binding XRE family transcriptional regulator